MVARSTLRGIRGAVQVAAAGSRRIWGLSPGNSQKYWTARAIFPPSHQRVAPATFHRFLHPSTKALFYRLLLHSALCRCTVQPPPATRMRGVVLGVTRVCRTEQP